MIERFTKINFNRSNNLEKQKEDVETTEHKAIKSTETRNLMVNISMT